MMPIRKSGRSRGLCFVCSSLAAHAVVLRATPLLASLLVALTLGAPQAAAQTTLALTYGERESITRTEFAVSLPSRWSGMWGPVAWSVLWNFDVAQWRSQEDNLHPDNRRSIWDVGFTPSVRFRGDVTSVGRPFADLGLGIHVLEDNTLGTKSLGTSWEFGEFGGVGLLFGPRDDFGLSFRVMHESNAGIKDPNNGLTVYLVRLEYTFQ